MRSRPGPEPDGRAPLWLICRMRNRIVGALAFAALGAVVIASPARAAVIDASCNGCGGLPIWLVGLLVVAGLLLAMAILWLPPRLARRVQSPRLSRLIVIGGWVILTIAFVLAVRGLVLVLGGT